jgi:hypothetical protein
VALKIIVSGDREWKNKLLMRHVMSQLPTDTQLVHGGARGADKMSGEVATELGWPKPIVMNANWKKFGKGAGPIRNQEMLTKHPDVAMVLAFHQKIALSKGTKDMIHRSRKVVPVRLWWADEKYHPRSKTYPIIEKKVTHVKPRKASKKRKARG